MRFLVDRCAGRRVAGCLADRGHDALYLQDLGPDPGDAEVLRLAAEAERILVTIDTDFGQLIFAEGRSHSGLIRLPDVRVEERLGLLLQVLERHAADLGRGATVTVRGRRIRVSLPAATTGA